MERWEYTSIKVETKGFMGGILDIEDFNYELNRFGEQVWELVPCLTTSSRHSATKEVVAVFKRKK